MSNIFKWLQSSLKGLPNEDTQSIPSANENIFKCIKDCVELIPQKILIGSIGEQSIGKSTLLKKLFKKEFGVNGRFDLNQENKNYYEKIEEEERVYIDFKGFDRVGVTHDIENIILGC